MIIMETDVGSITGKYLYSDYGHQKSYDSEDNLQEIKIHESKLNKFAKIPLIGRMAGIMRIALGAIHIIAHLFAAIVTFKKGHLFHVSKGMCEILRGVIETIPIIGCLFAIYFVPDFEPSQSSKQKQQMYISYNSFIIKIYHPHKKDLLDDIVGDWQKVPDSKIYR